MKYTQHQATYWYNISSQYALLENGIYLFICLFVYLFICLFVYLFICLFICLFIYLFMYLCIYVCMYVCMYLFIYLFIYFIGIGNPEGSSVVVRYQHDINNLRDMVKSTLQGYNL